MRFSYLLIFILALACATSEKLDRSTASKYSLVRNFGEILYILDNKLPYKLYSLNFQEDGGFKTTIPSFENCNKWKSRDNSFEIIELDCKESKKYFSYRLFNFDENLEEHSHYKILRKDKSRFLKVHLSESVRNFTGINPIFNDNLGVMGEQDLIFLKGEIELAKNNRNEIIEKLVKGISLKEVLDFQNKELENSFYDYHFSKENNPQITFFRKISGDEFEVRQRLRDVKFISKYNYILKENAIYDIEDYDFKKKGFLIRLYGLWSYWDDTEFDQVSDTKIFLRIEEDKAKKFRDDIENLSVIYLSKPNFIISKKKAYECSDSTIKKIVTDDFYKEMFKTDPYLAKKGCKQISINVKTMDLKILKFRVENSKTGEVYWN